MVTANCSTIGRLAIALCVSFFFILPMGCDKEEVGGDPSAPLVFESLVAEKDSVVAGESVQIIATASGYSITYIWTSTAGDILGSGSTVTYVASPCQVGENTITCKVVDGNNQSEKKEVTIFSL